MLTRDGCARRDAGARVFLYCFEIRPIRIRRKQVRTPVSIASAVCSGDAEKVFGLEARAADQCAIDVRHCHQLRGVRRFHRAAIEDTDGFSRIAIPQCETLANERMGLATSAAVGVRPVPIAQTGS